MGIGLSLSMGMDRFIALCKAELILCMLLGEELAIELKAMCHGLWLRLWYLGLLGRANPFFYTKICDIQLYFKFRFSSKHFLSIFYFAFFWFLFVLK